MSPRDPASETLVGGMQAVRAVMTRLERRAASVIWNASPTERDYAIGCVMEAAQAFSAALEKCKEAPKRGEQPGGGMGPNCRQGYHEEFGICVPDN